MADDPEQSPCIGVCVLETSTGMCKGCLRTAHEIGIWRDATRDQRREILRRIESRRLRQTSSPTEPPVSGDPVA